MGTGERYVDEGDYGHVCAGRWAMDCDAWSQRSGATQNATVRHIQPFGCMMTSIGSMHPRHIFKQLFTTLEKFASSLSSTPMSNLNRKN